MDEVQDLTANQLTVLANLDHTVELGSGWSLIDTQIENGTFFRVLEEETGIPEQAASQLLLSGPANWQNPVNRHDVNKNGVVDPVGDILSLINEMNDPKHIDSDTFELPEQPSAEFPFPCPCDWVFFDVNGDGFLAPGDVLDNVNYLNEITTGKVEAAAEGESASRRVSEVLFAASTDRARDGAQPASSSVEPIESAIAEGRQAWRALRIESAIGALSTRDARATYSSDVDRLAADDQLLDALLDDLLESAETLLHSS